MAVPQEKMSSAAKPTELVTLGRPIRLGMLYDMRTDSLITGPTLWNPQKLSADNVSKSKQIYSNFELITTDNLETKTRALGINGSLKLSVIGGLVSLDGSAKFAYDRQATEHQTRMTLKYFTTTHFEHLTMEHLGKTSIDHPELLDRDIATHVVTGIVYGAEAYFIFDYSISSKEKKTDVEGTLGAMIKKIPTCKIGGEVKANWNDVEKKCMNKVNVTFHGDFKPDENPNTFADAVKLYQNIHKFLGTQNENTVPKKVYLYPLHLLESKIHKTLRDITSNVVDYCINTIEALQSFIVKATDLTKSSIFKYFHQLKDHLDEFIKRVSEFEGQAKMQMANLLPLIRSEACEETVLFDLFKSFDTAPFSQRRLSLWLKEKSEEIAHLTSFIGNLIIAEPTQTNISFELSSISSLLGDACTKYLFCLTFRLNEEEELQLTDMNNYLYNNKQEKSEDRKRSTPWYKNSQDMVKIRTNIQYFIKLARENIGKSGIKFVINEEYVVEGNKGVDFMLFEDGLLKENYIPPTRPGVPIAKVITANSVTLEWTDGDSGSEPIQKYRIIYGKGNTDKEKWKTVCTNDNIRSIQITGLSAATSFHFKVQSINRICLSAFSDSSESITTIQALKTSASIFKVAPDQRSLAHAGYYAEKNDTINILLLGPAGSGKTTLIQTLMNPKFTRMPFTAVNIRESQYHSMVLFDEKNGNFYQMNILDIPGLDEIRQINAEQLYELIRMRIKSCMSKLNCICFVARTDYVNRSDFFLFQLLMKFLGPQFAQITMLISTHAELFSSEKLEDLQNNFTTNQRIKSICDYCKLGFYFHGIIHNDALLDVLPEFEDVVMDEWTALVRSRRQLIATFISTANRSFDIKNI